MSATPPTPRMPFRDLPRLGELECKVMNVLWTHGQVTIREVINHLGTDPAYTTIATVLTNLGRKNMVTTLKDGRSTLYGSRVPRDEYISEQMGLILDCSRDRPASLAAFVDSLSPEDRAVILAHLTATP